ncbi:hypothetical protein C8A05DRAFT_45462 [Staphylotrichum tortipilum]|uniref:Alpha/beta-hydrolase n=1 Tax=Staphylotrichum tortipilum TaxID=2831512 RepID=A0AAN6MIC4_9PEZI|nr:hypothetical protein C8A05DRAFT_45462 [Staphylotrichum longicolle]
MSPLSPWLRLTLLSTAKSDSIIEHHTVTCASSGDITVSLHNLHRHDITTPLIIFIPPFAHSGDEPGLRTPLPSCFQDYPVAAIHYRWPLGPPPEGDQWSIPLHWPTPLHDVNFGYSWIVDHLGSTSDPSIEPRHAYIYGSYLGAGLATALALTESRLPEPDQSIAIRGLIAHNGIYNWSMFLPDHPIHKLKDKPATRSKKAKGKAKAKLPNLLNILPPDNDAPSVPFEEEGVFAELKAMTPALFADPANLFDPFASACLFFHTPNLHVPDDFTTPLAAPVNAWTAAVDNLAKGTSTPGGSESSSSTEEPEPTANEILAKATARAKLLKPPRKGYLIFPPRKSPLRIPNCLFLYDTPHEYPEGRAHPVTSENNFRTQAVELMGLMMRSVDMYELVGQKMPGQEEDDEDDGFGRGGRGEEGGEEERERIIDRRVQSCQVEPPALEGEGEEGGRGLALDEKAEGVVAEWLRERIDEDFGGEFDEEEEE